MARGANGVVGIEDILFLLRKSPVKVQRFVKYFKIKDMSSQAVAIQQNVITDANKRAKRCRYYWSLMLRRNFIFYLVLTRIT